MENLPEKIPREAGNLNDGQSYERKLLLFVAASLSQDQEVENFWIVSNPTGIEKIDDVVARVSFKDSEKKDIAVFVQAKLTSPDDKLLWLTVNKKGPTQKCYEIKLIEYEKAFYDVIQMMSNNKPETQELRKLLKGVDEKDYYVCIFTNAKNLYPALHCKKFNGGHPIYFMDSRKYGQYRQFDHKNDKYNSNFYKQLYVFIGQANFEDIDFSIAELLGEDYKHRLENLDKIVKDFMQRSKLCWVLTKRAFKLNWFKVLAMDWMYVDFEKVKKINPKFVSLWQKILAHQKVINLREDKMWPLLAYYYQYVIIKEVDENFEWQKGMTPSTKNSINQKYGENVTELRELLFLLWRERKLPLAIKSDCTRNILNFRDQFKIVEGGFVVFSSAELPDVITIVKQISDVEVLEEVMQLEVSLQGRPPVVLSDIGEWQIFSQLKIAQVLAWTNNLEDGRQHSVGPVLRKPDKKYITRTFTRKQDNTQDQKQNKFSEYFPEISHSTYVNNGTRSALKQGTKDDQQREIFTQDQKHNDFAHYAEETYQSSNALKQYEDNDHLPKQQREILTVEDVVELAGPGLHIITGEPGLGKSTVLEELAHKYSSNDFVIYVILRDCLEDIECDDTWPSIEADPIQYFFNKIAGKCDDIISVSIFQNHKSSKRLCLFLDGFDEILPLHGNKLSSLIAKILDNAAIPIFCTTRPHGEEQISGSPNTIFLKLSPFGDEQIRQYLKKIKLVARDIVKLFGDNFLSNPLHLNMISQIYEKAGNAKDITRGKMYKLFIESKHDIYNTKIGLSRNYARLQTNKSLEQHSKLALVDIFGRECASSKGLILDTELDGILEDIGEHNIGIVDVSKPKGKFRFHHRTFAEYLVADWLLQMTNQDISNKTHFKYVYEEVMRNHKNIRSMINELSRYFLLWSEASTQQLRINSDLFKSDDFGRNAAHAATSDQEQEKMMNSVYKSRLFYRKDAVLQWTCREFFSEEPNENSLSIVDEINKDYPTHIPLAESRLRRLFGSKGRSLSDRCTQLLTAIDSAKKDDVMSILKSKKSLLKTGLGVISLHSAITAGNGSIVRLLLDLRPTLLNEQDDNDNTALHIACAFGCRDIVLLLLEKHASLDIVNKQTWSPLEMAASEGHLEIVSLLLDHIRKTIDLERHATSTEHYNKLLFQKTVTIACMNGRGNVVSWLIEHGADPTLSNDKGWVPMHITAQKGQLEILTLLLEKGLDVNVQTNTGATPLHIAIAHNHRDTSKWLLQHGADSTLSDDNGLTAMHIAAQQGQLEILKLLLERGINVNAETNTRATPLNIVTENNHQDATEWLLEHGADPTLSINTGWAPMHITTQGGELEILTQLLERGFNVNAQTNTGATPLHIAIAHNRLNTTKWLLDHGADPTISDDNGYAAMHYAAQQGQLEILTLLLERTRASMVATPLNIVIETNHQDATKWLLEHGADPTLSINTGWAAMHIAAQDGQLEILTLLLERGLNVNTTTYNGSTPLCIAIQNNHLNITKWLLVHGADPTLSTNIGWTPMHIAAREGHLEILKVLWKNGLNTNAKSNTGTTPLHIATAHNHPDTTEWLLMHGADPTLSTTTGWTAMHIAAREENLEILKVLLEKGLNVNAKTNTGATPLHIATAHNHLDTTGWLLAHDADPTLSTNIGWTAMHIAAKEGHLEILKVLWKNGLNVNAKETTGATPLHIASAHNHLETTEWLLDHGSDPTLSTNIGWTAMHIAAQEGHLDILKLLLERGLNVNAQTSTGATSLNIAILNNRLDTSKWLLKHGADPTLSTNTGWAAMHCAAEQGQLQILTLLLERGLNVNAKTNKEETPLYIAILNNHSDTSKWLLEHGADPTLLDHDGRSAMHYAACQGQLEIMTLLLERGLNVNSKTKTGATPLLIANEYNRLDATKWLLEHGADPTLSVESGWAAMHFAAQKGQLEILMLLLEMSLNVNTKTNAGMTPLHIAVDNNHLNVTESLLEHGADPTLLTNTGWAVMHFAARNGQIEILALLLKRGLNVNAKTDTGDTLLTFSIVNEFWKSAKWLLDHGADPTLATDNGWRAIHNAVREGQIEILAILLERGLSLNSKPNMGETLFAIAITSKHYDTVKWLLDHGVDPTLLDEDGWTAMHYAAIGGHVEILSLLLERGLNVNAETDMGEAPLTISIDNEHWDSVKWLLDNGADPTLSDEDGWAATHYATSKGQIDILALLLKTGLSVDAKTKTGETLLTIAISSKHLNTVEWLLDHGADPTLSDGDGWTAMHFAATTGQLEMLKLLLERGLDVNSKSNTGQTPLTLSFDNEHWGCVKWVLEHGANHTVSRDDGWSAMHYAALAGELEILSLLLDRGLNVNAKSNTGGTPLSISIDDDHWDTVKWLLEHGAEHGLSRVDGWACIHFAAKRGQLEILTILLDRGLNINARTNMSETPLTIAINYENLDTAKWLLDHGAGPTLSDEEGWSPIHFAAKRGQLEILIIVLDGGLDVNAATNTGETPLTIASKYEHSDIVDWLLEHGAQQTMMYETEA